MPSQSSWPEVPYPRKTYGELVPDHYRVTARSPAPSRRQAPGRRLPWHPSPEWVTRAVAREFGPLLIGPCGVVAYRSGLGDAELAAAQLREALAPFLEAPPRLSIDVWEPELEVWQSVDLPTGGDARHLAVLGELRCADRDAARALTVELRRAGHVFVAHKRRTVLVAATSEAQLRTSLDGHEARLGKIVTLKPRRLHRFLRFDWYDRQQSHEAGGWLAYDPPDD